MRKVFIAVYILVDSSHKMLIFKRGIDFSSVRRQTLFPTLFPWEEGIPCSKRNQFQLELIPKFGIIFHSK